MLEVGKFYDALAPWDHRVYQDSEPSIGRQGSALSSFPGTEWDSRRTVPSTPRLGPAPRPLARTFPRRVCRSRGSNGGRRNSGAGGAGVESVLAFGAHRSE